MRLLRESNARLRYLTVAEEEQIRVIISKRCPIHEADFVVAIETGMRLTEQHTVEWPEVDLTRRQIQLVQTKNGTTRVVVLSEDAVAALKLLKARRSQSTNRVFLTRYGEPMQNPRAWFRLVMKDAVELNSKLEDVTWHVLRHTYISRLVMAGVPLATVQVLAGHQDYKMTTRYAHLSPDHKLEAVDMLAVYKDQERKRSKERSRGH